MIVIKQVVQGIRNYLGYPDYLMLPNHTILLRLYDEMDHQRNQMNLPNQGWFLTHQQIDVTPGSDEIPVAAIVGGSRFVPILVTTRDDSDPTHIRREVPIVTVQDMDLYYIGPQVSNDPSAFPNEASSMAFYTNENSGQFVAKVTPQANQTASYDVWYQPDRPNPPGFLGNYTLLESFVNLMKVSVAIICLPDLLKPDGGNAAQLNLRQTTLATQQARYDSVFEVQKQMSFNQDKGRRFGFATDDDLTYGYY